jgi:bacteriocin biosynthesis cyclodehydratase domain-containing protein
MPTYPFRKPLLPSHYSVWFEPPDEAGDEVLHIVSERRSLKLKGHSFREFRRSVIPLLDGNHTLESIQEATRDVFRTQDLNECFSVLSDQGVLVEGDGLNLSSDVTTRMAPQLNWFHDAAPGLDLQLRLMKADVAVVGLGGAGSAAALALGAAGIGTVRCVDSLPVTLADVYLTPAMGLAQVGANRASATASLLGAAAPQVKAHSDDHPLESEDQIRAAIKGADMVVCCLDASQSNLIFKLNRVCLADGIRWISCALAGAEIIVGPAIHPGHGPCYLCYRMRAVACAGNPEEAFAYEKYLDRRKRDDSACRENLVFGAGLAANFLGMEVLKDLTGLCEPSLVGQILTIRLTDLTMERHTILRKPWCPACFREEEGAHAG